MGGTRLLAVMGSGETSPTMAPVHRDLLARLGPGARIAVVDTPVGFQLNAGEVAARAAEYFRRSVGRRASVASLRSVQRATAVERESALAAISAASYVFAGPGSPTYALRQWRDTTIPDLLRAKLRSGGCVTFSSAAALTLGAYTVPVYEIYKAGQDLRWEPGLDLLSEAGLKAAVIPHFDNREGGTHDTRYCYLGHERLVAMEALLPDDTLVVGVDEHTALVLDLGARTAAVAGLGRVTIRMRGLEHRLSPGATVAIGDLSALERGPRPRQTARGPAPGLFGGADAAAAAGPGSVAASLAADFRAAMARAGVTAATNAVLELEDHLWRWSTQPFGTDELDRARAELRQMILALSETAALAARRDPAAILAPVVDALLGARARARRAGKFEIADALRAGLAAAGIEVRDTQAGPRWYVEPSRTASGADEGPRNR